MRVGFTFLGALLLVLASFSCSRDTSKTGGGADKTGPGKEAGSNTPATPTSGATFDPSKDWTWDLKAMDPHFKITDKLKYDPIKNRILFSVESIDDHRVTDEVMIYDFWKFDFYDSRDVRNDTLGLLTKGIFFRPLSPKKGEKVDAEIHLPDKEICQKVKRVVLRHK